jgi:tRNA G10  N-methylase Trm11
MKVFLSSVENMLPRGKKICTASPKSIRVGNIGREVGFKHVESHLVYVHRSLTREIAVFERT